MENKVTRKSMLQITNGVQSFNNNESRPPAPTLPLWPGQLTSKVAIPVQLGPSINGSWYFDIKAGKQRMDVLFALHDFATIYDYTKQAAYYYYQLFNSYVCFTQPLPITQLWSSPFPNATFQAIETCSLGGQELKCQTWSLPMSYTYLTWWVVNEAPFYLAGFSQSTGMFQSNSYDMSDYVVGPPPSSTWVVPGTGTVCPPWPGSYPFPPP